MSTPFEPVTASGRDDLTAVGEWLARHGRAAVSVEALAGDVSTRRYYRVVLESGGPSFIVARYPRELAEAQRRFVVAAEMLARSGVRVPEVALDDPDAGYALLEDLGRETVHERFAGWHEASRELEAALDAATAIRQLDPERVVALGSPTLDESLLRRELAQTVDLLLRPSGLATTEIVRALDALCADLAERPLVPCHRDFMARNLVPVSTVGVAVLDFQDLRLGPAGYDLASLLNDSLFADDELESRVLSARPDLHEGVHQYRLAVAQRSLKAVGTYLAFARRGQRRHLPLVVPTLERALRQLPRLASTRSIDEDRIARIRVAGRDAALC